MMPDGLARFFARTGLYRLLVKALALCTLCAIAVPSESQTRLPFRIRADSAACLVNNSARYRSLSDEPFYLYLDLCPQVQPTDDQIAALNSNIEIKERKAEKGPPVRGIVRVNRKELTCLLNQIGRQQSKARRQSYVLINLSAC